MGILLYLHRNRCSCRWGRRFHFYGVVFVSCACYASGMDTAVVNETYSQYRTRIAGLKPIPAGWYVKHPDDMPEDWGRRYDNEAEARACTEMVRVANVPFCDPGEVELFEAALVDSCGVCGGCGDLEGFGGDVHCVACDGWGVQR